MMKKTTAFLALLTCILFTKTYGQFYKPDAESLKLLNTADYIFEGIVLDSKPYYHTDGAKILTTCKVKITLVYKGNLKEGTIELIREAGEIGLDYQYDDAMLSIGYNTTTVFICKKSNFASVSKDVFENENKVSLINEYQGTIRYAESETGRMYGLNEIYFNTKKEFESTLLKVKGVKIPKATARRSQVKRKNFEAFMAEQNKRVAIAQKNKKKSRMAASLINNDLKITLANETITQTGATRFSEFDVMVSANNSFTYFSNAIIRLDYNTSFYGNTIAKTPGALLLTNGSAFPVSEYVSNQYDVNTSRINISLGDKSSTVATWNRTRLTTTPVVLLHLKIKIVGCTQDMSIITLADTAFTQMFSLFATSAGAKWDTVLSYDNTNYTNTIASTLSNSAKSKNTKIEYSKSALCSSGFTFSPAKIHSGNNEVLTITGAGFGTTTGNVLFQNANGEIKAGDDNFLKGLDDNYIKSWTDTKIEVYVPSKVTEGDVKGGGASSGKFKVVKSNGRDVITSSTALDIEYAMTNLGNGTNDPFGKYQLVKINCINGLLFTLHTSFQNNTDAVITVEKALKDWADKLNITLALERNAQGQVVYVSDSNAANKNVIYFDVNYLGYAETSVLPTGIETNGAAKKYYRTNTDIKFNPNKPWYYIATGNLPIGKSDFYQAITHEIGHALGLGHAVDAANGTKDLMYYTASRDLETIIPATQRINLNTFGTRAVSGATAKIAIDKATTWITPNIATLGTVNPVAPTITASGVTTFCAGGKVTLTASPSTNYLWSNGATTNSIVASTTGAFSVTTTGNGCSPTSKPITVTVNEKPVIIKQPVALITCAGETVLFTLTAIGAGLKYQWQYSSNNGFSYANISNNTTFSGALTNTLLVNKPAITLNNWIYRCIVTNTSACKTISNAVKHTMTTVTLAPFNSVYQTAPAFKLTGGSPSGGTYSGIGVSNGVFNPASVTPGIYVITYSRMACSPAIATQTIKVVPCCAATITTDNLSSTAFKLSTTVTNVTIGFTALGSYTTGNQFIAQLSNATGSFTSPVNIGKVTGISSGKIVATIPNTTAAGSSYRIRVISTSPTVIGSNNGKNITISKATQRINTLDIIENQNEEYILYPNPATDIVNLSLPENSLETTGYADIVITDVNGRIVKKIQSRFLTTLIDVSDLSDGIYIFKIGEKNKEIIKKLLVKHT